jgi:hypothetical protein
MPSSGGSGEFCTHCRAAMQSEKDKPILWFGVQLQVVTGFRRYALGAEFGMFERLFFADVCK